MIRTFDYPRFVCITFVGPIIYSSVLLRYGTYGMIWYGAYCMVWYLWYGMAWYGMVPGMFEFWWTGIGGRRKSESQSIKSNLNKKNNIIRYPKIFFTNLYFRVRGQQANFCGQTDIMVDIYIELYIYEINSLYFSRFSVRSSISE